ncbi:hypothetical protein FSB78_00490 [Sphingomonas ginsenosidivorax]|uniref:Uncharacterized protein n=1 Tax=Sphingomonas ginsenosidivorax TaxID=862135 RepID=A0A5C6UBW4_9SPHN|nr:hypothetical protein [Sphingomonas ginsenosidivorax]TXC69606.1 hypothetical protein FSB78_00490 [Sphingomonas ginsenosidivorax]
MTGDTRGPAQITRRGDEFFRTARPMCDSNAYYLKIGQTDWHGPFPFEGEWAREIHHVADRGKRSAAKLALTGVHFHIRIVGAFIRTRRLADKPSHKKLADWAQLLVGQSMMLNPYPTPADVELGRTRVAYMRHNKCGTFRCWTDDADGALWVERLTAPP